MHLREGGAYLLHLCGSSHVGGCCFCGETFLTTRFELLKRGNIGATSMNENFTGNFSFLFLRGGGWGVGGGGGTRMDSNNWSEGRVKRVNLLEVVFGGEMLSWLLALY